MKAMSLPRTPVGLAYVLALAAALLVALGLSAALWVKASAKPSVLLVSAHDDPKVVTPGLIPDALARDFARDFIVTLESYVPGTLEKNLSFLEGRVAPSESHAFGRLAEGLRRLVKESKQASQLVVEDPEGSPTMRDGTRIEVVLKSLRRIFVENALLQEARVVYRVAVVSAEPTRSNPTGLFVAGFSVKLEAREEASDGKR